MRHGYGIIREVAGRTDGLITLRTGTLYTLLQRLLADELIAESDSRPPADEDDERRRYYELTPFGREVLAAEVHRLDSALVDARRRKIIPRPKSS